MNRFDSILAVLKTADDWDRKGQPAWSERCLSSALITYLNLALVDHGDPELSIGWLRDQGVPDNLRRYRRTLDAVIAQVETKQLPHSVIGGNYHSLVFAHLAWCMEEFQLGESFVAFSKRPDVGELSTKFWREYATGMNALTDNKEYHPTEMRLRGQEQYWMSYLRLIEVACRNQPLDSAITELKRSFAKRNADKNIRDDSYQIEGSASQPVRWDFRAYSLLRYIHKNRGQ